MSSEKKEIVLGLQAAQAELEAVLEKLASIPEPSLGLLETTCHALRNYLSVTRGTAVLLQDALREYPAQDVHTWIDALVRASDLMLNAVSQIEPSGSPSVVRIRWEVVDIGRMLQRFCEHYRHAANQKLIAIEYQLKTTKALGWTDRVMLASIFESILSNALKYSPRGKRVTVTTQDDARGVRCVVQDEGPGLSAEECARVFEPGARLSPKPTGNEKSRGYGLAVAKKLADDLGIELRCTSELGQGCTFSVLVPQPEPKANPPS